MRKVLAIVLSFALMVPAASLMAQQAPAKVQPVQTAYQSGAEGGVMGMSMGAAIAVAVAIAVAIAASDDSNDAVASASGTR